MKTSTIEIFLAFILLLGIAPYSRAQENGLEGPVGVTYVGVWPDRILVMDAKEHKIAGEIKLQSGVPEQLMLSYNQKRMIAITAQRNIEIIDTLTRKPTGHFPVVEGNRQALVMSGAISPSGRYLCLTVRSAKKEIDRYVVEKARFHVYDLDQKKLVNAFEFPKEFDQRLGFADTSYKISRDEKFLYLFREDILIFDLASFKQVDKIELSRPAYPGQFAVEFDGDSDPNEEPEFVTSVFTATDPLSHRPIAGVVSVNLISKRIEATPIGPAMPIRGGVFLSPDRKRAYAVVVNQAQDPNRRPEFWVVDLETRRVVKRVEFENRPRFTFSVSSNGKDLYVWGPGPVIDVFDSETLKLKQTVTVGGDITEIVVPRPRG